MPTIAIPNYSAVNPASGGARIDAQAAAAPFGALAQAGGQIANVGQMIGQITMQRQQHVNQGILANEDTIRRNTYAEIQEYAAQNQSNPESWDTFAKEKWQEYQNGRTSRAESDGWGPDVKEADALDMKQFSARANIMFDAERSKALIRQSNGRIEASAQTKMNAGDLAGSLAEVNKLNISPEAKQAKVEQISNGVIYGRYDRQMSDVSTLPPAQQSKEFAAIEAELAAKDKDGVPVNGWVESEDGKKIGGLTDPARTDLLRAARARRKAADVQIENEVGRLLDVYMGAGPNEFNQQAETSFREGKIDAQVTASEGDKLGFSATSQGAGKSVAADALGEQAPSVLTREAKENARANKAARAEAEAFAKKERDMREKAQDWGKRAMKGTLSQEAVEVALKRGEIMQDDAENLLSTIRARGELDTYRQQMGGGYGAADFTAKIAAYAEMTPYQKDRVGLKDRMAMLAAIDDDPVLGVEAKAKAMRTYLDAMNVDLQGWSEDSEPQRTLFNGREINKTEAKTRAQVGRAFTVAPNLGEGWAGTAMIRAEKEISAFFTSDTYRDDEAHAKLAGQLVETISAQVYDLAASKLMGGLYP